MFTLTHKASEVRAEERVMLCRCEASAAALSVFGFTVEVRTHSMGAWHVVSPGLPLRGGPGAGHRRRCVTRVCHCGAERERQAAHRARVAAREAALVAA